MAPDNFKRKLTAILSADVKGYSRLMGADEEWTLRTLNTYKGLIRNLVGEHRGRVVGSPGDNVLADFASVVDAVECAVEIQQVLRTKNALLPETRKMDFRIGINLGDVIEEGDSIYGDGVNIAARLEGLADAGGICISESAYQQIENKIPLRYDYLGEHAVKNIAKPVRVYRARIEPEASSSQVIEEKTPGGKRLSRAVLAGIALVVIASAVVLYQFVLRPSAPKLEVASKDKMAFPLPDKPSIAVLPFTNMSGDPKEEYFSDGITEEIITALSKVPYLFVVARNSTFTYKSKPVKVKQVSEELGVRYVLQGSVRKVGNKVRITAQLIDAFSGLHLWADRYDRDQREMFALQDEITKKILTELNVKLTVGEHATLYGKGTNNLEAYIKVLQGREYYWRFNREGNSRAKKLFEEANALDPRYPAPYWLLGMTHIMDAWFDWGKSKEESLSNAIELAQKTISLDQSNSNAHGLLSAAYRMNGHHEKAIAEGERAVGLDPNSPDAHVWLGLAYLYADKAEEAIPSLEKAIRLNPFAHAWYFTALGTAYRNTQRYDDAIAMYQKALKLSPENLMLHICLITAYTQQGNDEKAQAHAAEVLKISPDFSLDGYAKRLPYKSLDVKRRVIEALRKAGLR